MTDTVEAADTDVVYVQLRIHGQDLHIYSIIQCHRMAIQIKKPNLLVLLLVGHAILLSNT